MIHGVGVHLVVGSHGGGVWGPVLLEDRHVPVPVQLLLPSFVPLVLHPRSVVRFDEFPKTQLVGFVQLFVAVHLRGGHHVVLPEGRHVPVPQECLLSFLLPPYFFLRRLPGGCWLVPCLMLFHLLCPFEIYGWDFDWGALQQLMAGLPQRFSVAVAQGVIPSASPYHWPLFEEVPGYSLPSVSPAWLISWVSSRGIDASRLVSQFTRGSRFQETPLLMDPGLNPV